MVDAVTSPSPTPETPPTAAPQPVPAAAPVTASPVPAAQPPAAEPAPVVASPAPAPAPSTEKPVEPSLPAAAEPAAAVPTLLEQFDKEKADAEAAKASAAATASKPVDKKAEAEKPTDAKPAPQQPTAAAPAPFEYKYTLPETIKMDDAVRGEVHKAFDDFRADPNKGAQALVNLHERQMQAYAKFLSDEQQRVWIETKQGWDKKVRSDPELGGSGYQTTMGAIARMRDLFVQEKDRAEFEEFLRVTGAGWHPAFHRMLHQAARIYDEPSMPPPNPRPAKDNGRRPTSRLRDIYDHPRSTSEGRS